MAFSPRLGLEPTAWELYASREISSTLPPLMVQVEDTARLPAGDAHLAGIDGAAAVYAVAVVFGGPGRNGDLAAADGEGPVDPVAVVRARVGLDVETAAVDGGVAAHADAVVSAGAGGLAALDGRLPVVHGERSGEAVAGLVAVAALAEKGAAVDNGGCGHAVGVILVGAASPGGEAAAVQRQPAAGIAAEAGILLRVAADGRDGGAVHCKAAVGVDAEAVVIACEAAAGQGQTAAAGEAHIGAGFADPETRCVVVAAGSAGDAAVALQHDGQRGVGKIHHAVIFLVGTAGTEVREGRPVQREGTGIHVVGRRAGGRAGIDGVHRSHQVGSIAFGHGHARQEQFRRLHPDIPVIGHVMHAVVAGAVVEACVAPVGLRSSQHVVLIAVYQVADFVGVVVVDRRSAAGAFQRAAVPHDQVALVNEHHPAAGALHVGIGDQPDFDALGDEVACGGHPCAVGVIFVFVHRVRL